MKISEIMTRDVRAVRPDQSAREAASFMLREDTGAIPVIDGETLVGMITDRDIAVRGVANGHGPDTRVSELMSSGPVCARIGDDADEIAVKMSEAQVRRMPVLDENDRLVGIVSLGDFSREADDATAEQILEGVSAPGDQHRQG